MDAIKRLWRSAQAQIWYDGVERYWLLDSVVHNNEAERRMENLTPERFQRFSPEQVFDLLANPRSGYYQWKFGYDKRLVKQGIDQIRALKKDKTVGYFASLQERLLRFDRRDIYTGLSIVKTLPRIGDRAASGFLGVLFKSNFAAVDRWIISLLHHLTPVDFPE